MLPLEVITECFNVPGYTDAKEEDVRDLLSSCGEVENVRLVRDAANNVGKGIGFVLFKVPISIHVHHPFEYYSLVIYFVCIQEASSVKKALTYNTSKFHDRELRITRAVDKETLARNQAKVL
jgi:RNA recognition motif-containing protein